ncbi:syntaxin-binding protein 5-like [Bombyx mandarina]|uniref:Syntaxin-binding protein 5-like n=1 Tax=Bombyx mandarina TaxID=7092 RepID=A0A6J2KPJ4_BOMMA|nr:syntaxin-binding protein 5-like [Bombyx mandarina]
MKKFTFKGVLDGFRSSMQAAPRGTEQEIQETLRPEHFQVKKTFRHGFPFSPTALAWDPIQKLLAIGDKTGNLRMYPLNTKKFVLGFDNSFSRNLLE